jgi:sulfur-oxidizing protein SoxY
LIDHSRRRCLQKGVSWAQVSALLPWCMVPVGATVVGQAHSQTHAQSQDAMSAVPEFFAYADDLFRSTRLEDCLALLAGAVPIRTGSQAKALVLEIPDMADNGAAVPIAVRWQGSPAKLGQVVELAILVDKNPLALSMLLNLPSPALPAIKTRIKLNQSSDVCAFLKIDNRCYVVRKPVRVTLGGCIA